MANVNISPTFNQAHFVSNTGNLLNGGKIYTFAANTSNSKVTYTDSSGTIYNSNPITLDSSGRMQSSIWLIPNQSYDLILTDNANNIVQSVSNVVGVIPTNNVSNNLCPVFKDTTFYDNYGEVLSNGKIYVYKNNSFTEKAVSYTSNVGNVINPNPLTLSNVGTLDTPIYLNTTNKYNLVLTDSNGTNILKYYNSVYTDTYVSPPSPLNGIYFDPTQKASQISLSNFNYTAAFGSISPGNVEISFTNGVPINSLPPLVVEFEVSDFSYDLYQEIRFGVGVVSGAWAPSNYNDVSWYTNNSKNLSVAVTTNGTNQYIFSSPIFTDNNFNLTTRIGMVFRTNLGGLYCQLFINGVNQGSIGNFSILDYGLIVPYCGYYVSSGSNPLGSGKLTIHSDLDNMQYKAQYVAAYPTVQNWPEL